MGLGRRTFSPGEVLTASNVMNYLQDQAVMSFAGTAARGSAIGTAVQEGMVSYLQDTNFLQVRDDNAWHSIAGVQAVANATVRDSLIPAPNQGDKVFRSDLGYEQTYYAAWGTANPGGRASAGWYDNQRNMGLVPIVPPTVNYSGGTATANTLGTVSFSAVTSISLNNVFSSTYKNYQIIIGDFTTSINSSAIRMRLRVSGSDNATGSYYQAGAASYSASPVAYLGSGATSFGIGDSSTSKFYSANILITNPFIASETSGSQIISGYSGAVAWVSTNLLHNGIVSFDGLSIYPSSGTMTGSIQVFGYNS